MANHPRIFCAVLLVVMWAMSLFGTWLRSLHARRRGDDREDNALIVSAALTLLGLIIGFMFSMATTRYDLRRQFEEGEANAIGTELVRCDLMPPAQASATRNLLSGYLHSRIAFYNADSGDRLRTVNAESSRLQASLWSSVLPIASAQPTPVTALVVSGMNDVLNSQGYAQASWWNRIPPTAWALLISIACTANLLVGYGTKPSRSRHLMLFVLPLLVAVAMFLIADIDSPRGGIIRIPPVDLMSLEQSLK